MTTPAYSELVAAVRLEGTSLIAAAAQGLDADVPTCPGWTVGDLLTHITGIYLNVGSILSNRLTAAPEQRPEVPTGDPIQVATDALDELVQQLGEASGDTPVWNWSSAPHDATFWARRMAHESSVHRFDAQRAHDVAQPIDADLAADELEEFLELIAPRIIDRDGLGVPPGVVRLVAVDETEWVIGLAGDHIERLEVAPSDATVVSGTASALVLACYSRTDWSSLDIDGDEDLLAAWTAALKF